MADNPPPAPAPPAETGTPNTVANVSGGVNINAQGGDVHIGGDVVGRDKITTTTVINQTVVPRDKNLSILLDKVRDFWVKGVLENSVHHAALIELGKQVKADAVEVDHPWETVVRTADQPDRTLPPDQKIVDVFDEMKGALLILGEPGAGKTTTLLELARDLIARAEDNSTLPVPAVFNLSSWAEERKTIAEWLVDELKTKYRVPSKMGRQWIENNALILLLDGLDEVKSEHRKACADAINEFRSEHGLTSIVVCSRIREYEELASRLRMNGAVLIQPLTREQVDHYIVAGGPQLAALGNAIQADVVLQELAQVPLTLSIMSLAYSGPSADSLTSVLDDSAQRRKLLFNAYVDERFAPTEARAQRDLYSREDTVHWLAWLAARMSEHGETVFLIERMQPSWLRSQRQRWIFSIVSSVLLLGLLFWLLTGLVGALIGVLFGVLLGTVGGWASRRNSRWMKIKLAESLKLSWSGAAWGSGLGVGLGLVLGAVFRGESNMVVVLGTGLFMGVFTGLFVAVTTTQIETKTKPNQGVWLSGKNALFLMLFFWLFSGLLLGLLGATAAGLRAGLIGGLLFGEMFGGAAFIEHFELRFILWRSGDIPRNYVRFLDYAAERIFLRKVGGGYIFIHRMLVEYFASLETQPSTESGK
jgi:hypothetical protein